MPVSLFSRRHTAMAVAALLLLALLAGYAWLQWRGPLLAGYRLESRALVQRVVASGEVSSQSLAQVGSEITAVVSVRHVREGDRVEVGDLLLELRSDELQARVREAEAALRQLLQSDAPQAQAALREAQTRLAQASRERERRQTLAGRQLLAAEALEQTRQTEIAARLSRDRAQLAATALAPEGSARQVLEQRLAAARAALAKTRIYAQVAGRVQRRNVEPGDLVQPGRSLFEIARSDSREILLPLDEKNMAPVALGQSAQVIADAYPARVLQARVSFIAPQVDSARGTLDVHLELLDAPDFLLNGMTVSVNILTGQRSQTLVLANDALRARDGQNAEVLRLHEGKVQRQAVRLGLLGTAQSEVLEGLQVGDLVLAVDAAEGQRVRVALQVPATDTGVAR